MVVLASILAALTLPWLSPQVVTSPAESGLVFSGHESFREEQLLRVLDRLQVRVTKPLSRVDVDDAAFFIDEFYLSAGFLGTEVTYEYDPATASGVILIKEGEPVRLGRLSFSGQTAFPEGRLRDVATAALRRASRRLLGPLGFVEFHLDDAVTALQTLYANEGYLATSIHYALDPGPDRRTMNVHFTIEEGPVFRVRQVTVRGVPPELVPRDLLQSAEGGIYTIDEDFLLRQRLLQSLRDQGFFAAAVEVERQTDNSSGQIDLQFSVTPGSIYRIGTVTVEGQEKTIPGAIRGLFGIRPGQVYSAQRIRAGNRRLWFTGAFSEADVSLLPMENDTLDVLVRVEEGKARHIRTSVGYAQWEGAFGSIEYTDRNFFGTLTRFTSTIFGSQRGYGGTAYLTDPFLLNTEVSARIGGFYINQEWPGYRASIAGGVIGLERVFASPNETAFRLAYEYRAILDATIFGEDPAVGENLRYSVGMLSFGQTLDRRNDALVPMQGFFLKYNLGLASEAFLGELNYFRPTAQATFYQPLQAITPERPFVPFFLLNHRAGLILPYANTGPVPTPERFFLGGPNSVRSFQLDGMAPRDIDGDPIGGQAFVQFNAELQWPVFGPLFLAGFVDVGNLALTVEDWDWDETRIAPGLGLRIYTPIGAIFTDYGYNLVRKDGDPIGAFQFGFGFTF
jgi:outer membrane protein insertion porin family